MSPCPLWPTASCDRQKPREKNAKGVRVKVLNATYECLPTKALKIGHKEVYDAAKFWLQITAGRPDLHPTADRDLD